MRTLLVDNHDSFTYNLFHHLAELGGREPTVVENDDPYWRAAHLAAYDAVVLSPGPGHPGRAGDFGIVKRMAGFAAVLIVVLSMFLIVMTHRVAGPLYKIGMYFERMRDGRLSEITDLRRGDQFQDFFEHFKYAHQALRGRTREEIALYDRFLRACEAQPELTVELRQKLDELSSLLDRGVALELERRTVIQAVEERKAARNASSQEVARRKKAGEPADALIASGRQLGDEIQRLENELAVAESQLRDILLSLPNATLPDVPEGGEEANKVVRTWGEPRSTESVPA